MTTDTNMEELFNNIEKAVNKAFNERIDSVRSMVSEFLPHANTIYQHTYDDYVHANGNNPLVNVMLEFPMTGQLNNPHGLIPKKHLKVMLAIIAHAHDIEMSSEAKSLVEDVRRQIRNEIIGRMTSYVHANKPKQTMVIKGNDLSVE